MSGNDIFIGIDGGGTGTRVLVSTAAHDAGVMVRGGPSALSKGTSAAWAVIGELVESACGTLGVPFDWQRCVVVAGMAGAHHAGWKTAFEQEAPLTRALSVETDARITLLGAHKGKAGAVIALGTGCVGESWDGGGTWRSVGGFGFPAGDEASGSWFGLRASRYAQYALDGRARRDGFAQALLATMGVDDRESLTAWLMKASATSYASLAPVVFAHAEHSFVARLIDEASYELTLIAEVLDPDGTMPVALCGSVGEALRGFLPDRLRECLRRPVKDAVHGALLMARGRAAIGTARGQ